MANKIEFIKFNNFLNNKIIETLFDINIIINSVINEEKKDNILLEQEQNEIYELLNKFEKGGKSNNYNINLNENIVNGVKEKEKEKHILGNNINICIHKINSTKNSVSNNNSTISSTNRSCKSQSHCSSNKKTTNTSFSEEDEGEKSLNLLGKEIKNENKDRNLNKNKIYISEMNSTKIFHFLNFLEQKDNKIIMKKINKEEVVQKIKEIINKDNMCNCNELYIKKDFLRKNVCAKLYKTFSFLLRKYNINDLEVKKLCRIIENKARIIDDEMGNLYKEYIINILANLSII